MKKLLLVFVICSALSCKKDPDKTLMDKTWIIVSTKVTPAMTIGNKTSSNYLELMGPGSCEATSILTFSQDGTFSKGSNGALCDLFFDPNNKTSITWKRNGDQIFLSSSPNSPLVLNDNRLTQTTTTSPIDGIAYTFVSVYKAQSK